MLDPCGVTSAFSRLLAWLTRLLFALVVVGGAFSTAAAAPIEGESDLFEEGEDDKTVEREVFTARASRQSSTGKPATGAVVKIEVPRQLLPARLTPRTPPRPRVRRRRGPPDDEDDGVTRG